MAAAAAAAAAAFLVKQKVNIKLSADSSPSREGRHKIVVLYL